MIYILDFDGVLFDDRRFKSDFCHVFNNHGVTRIIYEQTYHQTKEAKHGLYEIDTHLAFIHRIDPRIDITYLRDDLFALAGRSHAYIFPDAVAFVRTAAQRNDELFLLSSGDRLFQKTKINASGLASFFQRVRIIVSASKAPFIAHIKKQSGRKKIIFIDDKKEIIDEIKKRNPNIHAVQMIRRAHMPKSEYADAYIKNFSAINIAYTALAIRREKR